MADGKTLQDSGTKLFLQKDYEAARQVFQQAVDAYEAETEPLLAAEMKINIGLIHRTLGENQSALDVMLEALRVFETAKDQRRMAMALGNLGGVYRELDDHEQAHNCYRRAADLFQELGEKQMQAQTLEAIASLQMKEGKIGTAAATYEAALGDLNQLKASQKLLKGMLGLKNRLTGGGKG